MASTQLLKQYLLLILLLFVILTVILYINRNRLFNIWRGLKTRFNLSRLGLEQVSSFQFPDGLGHNFIIDRLILRHDGITLLLYKRYPGNIYCADQIEHWTQLLGRKSYRFKNPLFELDNQVKTISAAIPGVKVNGYLFFDPIATFPKGHPERVICLDSIPDELKRASQKPLDKSVSAAWLKLLTMRCA